MADVVALQEMNFSMADFVESELANIGYTIVDVPTYTFRDNDGEGVRVYTLLGNLDDVTVLETEKMLITESETVACTTIANKGDQTKNYVVLKVVKNNTPFIVFCGHCVVKECGAQQTHYVEAVGLMLHRVQLQDYIPRVIAMADWNWNVGYYPGMATDVQTKFKLLSTTGQEGYTFTSPVSTRVNDNIFVPNGGFPYNPAGSTSDFVVSTIPWISYEVMSQDVNPSDHCPVVVVYSTTPP